MHRYKLLLQLIFKFLSEQLRKTNNFFFSNKIIPATRFSSDLSASWLTRDQNKTNNIRMT